MSTYVTRKSCRICEGPRLTAILDFPATPAGDKYVTAAQLSETQACFPLRLVYCEDCGLLQLPDVVDPKLLYGDYLYETAISLKLAEHFGEYARAAVRRGAPPANALVVDIGCNDGTLLKAFRDQGLTPLGIEPATAIAAKLQASGVETWNTFFSVEVARRIRREKGPAHIVTANNVLANIDDLGEVARGLSELLADDGVFYFESGYAPDTIGGDVIDNVYHEHLSYFRVKPLEVYFRRHGLELIDAEIVETKGGSLRGVVQKRGGPRAVSPRVGERIADEARRGFDGAAAYLDFAARMARKRDELRVQLTALKAQGKKIAGYGASVGVTTLLYYWGLAGIVDYLVDDNPVRHGRYSPGHHIPVLPSQVLYERRPDYVLILAWRYAEPIRKRHPRYEAEGGRFVIPPLGPSLGSPD